MLSNKIEKIKKKVRKEYGKQAPIYDEALESGLSINSLKKGKYIKLPKDWKKAIKEEPKFFIKLVNPKNREVALDVACGTGRILIELAKRGVITYGIDISPKMIKLLKQKVNKNKIRGVKELKVGSMERLPFKNNFFDIITCMGVLEHYPISFVKKCLKEMKRVVKNNGRIVIDIANNKSKLAKEFYESGKKDGTAYLYSESFLKKSIKSCGLKIIKINRLSMQIQFLLKG